MIQTRCWKPLLSGELHRRAEERIAEVIVQRKACPTDTQASPWALFQDALLYTYLARRDNSPAWREYAIGALNSGVDSFSSDHKPQAMDQNSGWAAIGWILEHTNRLLTEIADSPENEGWDVNGEDDPVEVIDTLLLDFLQGHAWLNCRNPIGGLVRAGLYFLERLPRPIAARGISLIVDQLEERARASLNDLDWQPQSIEMNDRPLLSTGSAHNLGVAYGIPGLVHFLSEAFAARIEPQRTFTLLRYAAHWLVAHQRTRSLSETCRNWFPLNLECSEMGVAAALYQAGCRVGDELWQHLGISLLDAYLSSRTESDDALDGSLLTGEIGVAHVCNRIYQISHDERFKQAAIRWFDCSLSRTHIPMRMDGPSSETLCLLFDGPVGSTLSLIAATHSIAPDWDRLLLLSGW